MDSFQQQFVFHGQYAAPMPVYTAQQLPLDRQQKPQVFVHDSSPFLQPLDTTADLYFMPSTPPLSTSGSTVNSPPSHSVLPTPVSAGVFDFGFEVPKPDLRLEHLAADWA